MGKKKVGRERRGKRRETVESPLGTLHRDGRFLFWESESDQAATENAITAYLDQVPGAEERREANRERLLEILTTAGAAEVVSFASLAYLRINPNTYKESDSDRLTSHIEYLALQVLAVPLTRPSRNLQPLEVAALAAEAIYRVRELFEDQTTLILAERLAAREANDKLREYGWRARLESMAIRGSAYHEHHERVIAGCLSPFGEQCLKLMGFTALDALRLPQAIHDIVDGDRLSLRAEEASEWRKEILRTLRKARMNPASYPTMPPSLLAGSLADAKRNVERFTWLYLYHDAESLMTITAQDVSDNTGIEVGRCQALLETFACDPADFDPRVHAYPAGAHPLTLRPLLRSEGGFIMPVPSSFVEAIRPRMEDLLRGRNDVWQQYLRHRARWTETEACNTIKSGLRGSRAWIRLPWQHGEIKGELDGLVACDDMTFRIQAKAGRISASARRGAPDRMRKQIGDLIRAGAEQHASLAQVLGGVAATDLGFSGEQAAALNAPIQIEVIVCLDEVTIWSTETHELAEIGMISLDRPIPWVLSLADLMATVDLLRDGHLLHYVARRQRLEVDGRISCHDELDWLGHYLQDGLYFESYFQGKRIPSEVRLLSYTEPIDAWYFARAGWRTIETAKPALPIPAGLARLLDRLASERPKHWTIASLGLLDGDQQTWLVWERSIRRTPARLAGDGWTNTSLVFQRRYGITLFVDHRIVTPTTLEEQVSAYCTRKVEELNEHMWIGIGEAATGTLIVRLTHESPPTLRDIFMQPGELVQSTLTEDSG